ncbi:hypothetical protein G6F64_015487 [Rhizopus arrhizus]|uniref:Uncharacterized protein n=1 Tax=Rhizopus oryzae TaxID=64495 RepID=A0A9P6WR99_RHIOR|nr:hypothetical protein G6F64_015487 [Rhizopus arrhizus]
MPCVTAADRIAEELFRRGNGRIECGRFGGLREEVRALCLRRLRRGQCSDCGDQQRKNGTAMHGHGASPGTQRQVGARPAPLGSRPRWVDQKR